MDFLKYIIPIIALVVWILANLAKMPQNNNAPRRPGPRPRPPEPNRGQGQSRQPVSDLDKFLQDVQNKRKQDGPPPQRRQPPPLPLPERPPERDRSLVPKKKPAPPPVSKAKYEPPRRESSRHRSPYQQQRFPFVPEVVPEQNQTAPREVALASSLDFSRSSYSISAKSGSVNKSGIGGQLINMLQNPESLRAAFVFREVFGEPISRRPRK